MKMRKRKLGLILEAEPCLAEEPPGTSCPMTMGLPSLGCSIGCSMGTPNSIFHSLGLDTPNLPVGAWRAGGQVFSAVLGGRGSGSCAYSANAVEVPHDSSLMTTVLSRCQWRSLAYIAEPPTPLAP